MSPSYISDASRISSAKELNFYDFFENDQMKEDTEKNSKIIRHKSMLTKKVSFSNSSINLSVHPFRQLIFSKKITDKAFMNYLLSLHQKLQFFTKNITFPESVFSNKKVLLPKMKNSNLKSLFLDLDETIVYVSNDLGGLKIELIDDNDEKYLVTNLFFFFSLIQFKKVVSPRPFLTDFLKKLKSYYEIFIFSSSKIEYTHSILDVFDPQQELIDGFLTINNCLVTSEGNILKPLTLIKNRDLKNMVMVTSSIECCYFNLENGIPIQPWNNIKEDQELKFLMNYLIDAANLSDLRDHNVRSLKLQKLMNISEHDLKK